MLATDNHDVLSMAPVTRSGLTASSSKHAVADAVDEESELSDLTDITREDNGPSGSTLQVRIGMTNGSWKSLFGQLTDVTQTSSGRGETHRKRERKLAPEGEGTGD